MYCVARMSTVISEVKTEVKSKRAKKPKVEKPKVEKVEKPKTVKTKVDKYNGFKVPDRKTPSTRWAIYLYDMIKEAKPDLLKREDVRNEYNNLVTCLRKYDGFIESSIPSKYYKYNSKWIDIIDKGVTVLSGSPFRWIHDNAYNNPQRNVYSEKKTEFNTEIKQVYAPLYELIKCDIIPYMELKQHEITSKSQIERYHYQMGKVERTIKLYESRIADLYKEMGKLSEEVMKCKEPPNLTVFE